jgi:type IV pilus assembly protein PilW
MKMVLTIQDLPSSSGLIGDRSGMGREKGFTLIELLVTIAIAGVVMAGVWAAYYTQQKSYRNQEEIAAVQQNLRAAMTLMGREIRMAGYDPTLFDGLDNDGTNGIDDSAETSGAGIVTAQAGNIQFTMDLTGGDGDGLDNDGDGVTDNGAESEYGDGDLNDPNETVSYRLSDSDGNGTNDTLVRNTGGGNQPMARNITALNFVYLDANNNVTGTIADIRSVVIALTGSAESGATRTLSTRVRCRNLGL